MNVSLMSKLVGVWSCLFAAGLCLVFAWLDSRWALMYACLCLLLLRASRAWRIDYETTLDILYRAEALERAVERSATWARFLRPQELHPPEVVAFAEKTKQWRDEQIELEIAHGKKDPTTCPHGHHTSGIGCGFPPGCCVCQCGYCTDQKPPSAKINAAPVNALGLCGHRKEIGGMGEALCIRFAGHEGLHRSAWGVEWADKASVNEAQTGLEPGEVRQCSMPKHIDFFGMVVCAKPLGHDGCHRSAGGAEWPDKVSVNTTGDPGED